MDKQDNNGAAAAADVTAAEINRRELVAKLAKAAIVPAVVVGIAATSSPAQAMY